MTLSEKAEHYLKYFSEELQTRRVGSDGNRLATNFFNATITSSGFKTECPQFECMDWIQHGATLTTNGQSFHAQVSPYSLGCRVESLLETVSTVGELEAVETDGKVLLLRGDIAKEQLMPKNFRFYNPEEHQNIVKLLETKRPLAIITATSRNPEMAGALYPFPMIEDGDFDIPSVYITEEEGEALAGHTHELVSLDIRAERIPSHGRNVIAFKDGASGKRIVLYAHIDSKDGTPGALDNASGVVVLLLLAELLKEYQGKHTVEIIALNGEDYYSTPGEIQFLEMNEGRFGDILLGVNFDGVGYQKGKTAYSLYEVPDEMAGLIRKVFSAHNELIEGEAWEQGDHMLFVFNQVPALAWTSDNIIELLSSIVHTEKDVPAIIDAKKLVTTAKALHELIVSLD